MLLALLGDAPKTFLFLWFSQAVTAWYYPSPSNSLTRRMTISFELKFKYVASKFRVSHLKDRCNEKHFGPTTRNPGSDFSKE